MTCYSNLTGWAVYEAPDLTFDLAQAIAWDDKILDVAANLSDAVELEAWYDITDNEIEFMFQLGFDTDNMHQYPPLRDKIDFEVVYNLLQCASRSDHIRAERYALVTDYINALQGACQDA